MAVHGRQPKRARRGRVTAEPCLLDMRDFPGAGEGALDGTFRDSVRGFLARCAVPAPAEQGGVLGAGRAAWQVGFRVGDEGEVAVMEVVEEDVPRARRVYCTHCTVAGEFVSPSGGVGFVF